jgi:uncharacterized membrane protein
LSLSPETLELQFNAKQCVKCGYKRQQSDLAPDWACPSCGVAYVKAEAAANEQKRLVEEEKANIEAAEKDVYYREINHRTNPSDKAKIQADKSIANNIYILTFLGALTGVTFLVALALAHKYNNAIGKTSWVHTHFSWQVRSFWFATLWAGLGFLIIAISFIAAFNRSFKDGMDRGYAVYGQIFGWLADPAFLKGLVLGGTVIIIAGAWHLVRMIQGYRALKRDEPI